MKYVRAFRFRQPAAVDAAAVKKLQTNLPAYCGDKCGISDTERAGQRTRFRRSSSVCQNEFTGWHPPTRASTVVRGPLPLLRRFSTCLGRLKPQRHYRALFLRI